MKNLRRLLALSFLSALVLPALAAMEGDHPPRPLKQVPVAYTKAMRKERPKGEVIIDFIIDEKGTVQKATVHKSLTPETDQAALECVQKWTFDPGVQNGKIVKTRTRQSIRFE